MKGATWAASIPLSALSALLPWRLDSSLHAAIAQDRAWLIALQPPAEDLQKKLRSIDRAELWQLSGDLMTAPGDRLATQRRPKLDWRPFLELSELDLQVAAFAGQPPAPIPIGLQSLAEKGVSERPAQALLLSASRLFDWLALAPEFRLRGLSFVLHGSEDLAIVRSSPSQDLQSPVLPPLPGQLLDLIPPFLLPLGRGPEPALDEDSWRLALGLASRELALLLDSGAITLIAPEAWQSLTRSAAARASGGRPRG